MGFEENYLSRLEWEAAGESLMAPVFCLFFGGIFLPPARGAKLVITAAATLAAATPKPEEAHTCRSAAERRKKKKKRGGDGEFSGAQTANALMRKTASLVIST